MRRAIADVIREEMSGGFWTVPPLERPLVDAVRRVVSVIELRPTNPGQRPVKAPRVVVEFAPAAPLRASFSECVRPFVDLADAVLGIGARHSLDGARPRSQLPQPGGGSSRPLLDHLGVGLLDESSDPSEHLAPPDLLLAVPVDFFIAALPGLPGTGFRPGVAALRRGEGLRDNLFPTFCVRWLCPSSCEPLRSTRVRVPPFRFAFG